MTHPNYSVEEARTHDTFMALMWSLSYPGKFYTLPENSGDALKSIGDTLLDIETSFYTDDATLVPHLQRAGARLLAPERAAYHFYPQLDEAELASVRQANIGTLLYPDEGATLIIGATFGTGLSLTLSGPGIPPSAPRTVTVGGVPAGLWQLREQAIRYPRGWDLYFVDGDSVLGLPRSTVVRIEE